MATCLRAWHVPVVLSAAAVSAGCSSQTGLDPGREAIIRRIDDRDNAVTLRRGPIPDGIVVLVDGRQVHNTSELPSDTSLIYSIEITKRVNDGAPQSPTRRSIITITTRAHPPR